MPPPQPPPPSPAWLTSQPDPTGFHGPADYFAVAVCQPRDLDDRARLEAAWRYQRAHGRAALVAALGAAASVEALPAVLADLRREVAQ